MAKVYVMDDGVHRKIGFSDNPKRRALHVRRENKVRVVFEIETDDHCGVERAAHIILHERRVAGEWFDVSIEDAVDAVREAVENANTILADHAKGGRQISASLNGAEADLLERAKRQMPDASQKEVIVEALRQMVEKRNGPDIDAAVAAELRRLAAEVEARMK